MPAEGIEFKPREEILRYEEMVRLAKIFIQLGIDKIRITGGEPFIRKDLLLLLEQLRQLTGLQKLTVTTNGYFTAPYLPALRNLLDGMNLSLDTLQEDRFEKITRRKGLDRVLETFYGALEMDIPLKLNVVVLEGVNTDEIPDFLQLARRYPIDVRFIEQMPFDGKTGKKAQLWTAERIYREIQSHVQNLTPVPTDPDATATVYTAPNWLGKIGIIAGYSRTFCHSCSRIRITATGILKTCLYDRGVADLKSLLRNGATDEQIATVILDSIHQRYRDGYEAEKYSLPVVESMATIGG